MVHNDYIVRNGQLVNIDELKHYGVLGMKWGVRRANYKSAANERLYKKSLSYDKKSANLMKKSEKAHANVDLSSANKAASKAANYLKKAAILEKKAAKVEKDIVRDRLHAKAEKFKYKSAKKQIDANRLSKTATYGHKAMKYSIKSDIVAKKAAKARNKIANNQYYISKMNQKISDIPKSELSGAYSFINELKSF